MVVSKLVTCYSHGCFYRVYFCGFIIFFLAYSHRENSLYFWRLFVIMKNARDVLTCYEESARRRRKRRPLISRFFLGCCVFVAVFCFGTLSLGTTPFVGSGWKYEARPVLRFCFSTNRACFFFFLCSQMHGAAFFSPFLCLFSRESAAHSTYSARPGGRRTLLISHGCVVAIVASAIITDRNSP